MENECNARRPQQPFRLETEINDSENRRTRANWIVWIGKGIRYANGMREWKHVRYKYRREQRNEKPRHVIEWLWRSHATWVCNAAPPTREASVIIGYIQHSQSVYMEPHNAGNSSWFIDIFVTIQNPCEWTPKRRSLNIPGYAISDIRLKIGLSTHAKYGSKDHRTALKKTAHLERNVNEKRELSFDPHRIARSVVPKRLRIQHQRPSSPNEYICDYVCLCVKWWKKNDDGRKAKKRYRTRTFSMSDDRNHFNTTSGKKGITR